MILKVPTSLLQNDKGTRQLVTDHIAKIVLATI